MPTINSTMYSLLIFLFTIAAISLVAIRFRVPPFLVLFSGALFFGIVSGMPLSEIVTTATAGMGRIFALLGLVILAGAVIAKLMQEQHQVGQVVSDLRSITNQPFTLAGCAGYILAIPLMCCITAFVILQPVISGLGRSEEKRKGLLYTTALASLIAFALIYPTPVIIALFAVLPETAISPLTFDLYMIPVSLLLLAGAVILMKRRFGTEGPEEEHAEDQPPAGSGLSRARAWTPFIVMGIVILAGGIVLRLSPSVLIQIVMFAGLITALLLAPTPVRASGFSAGAKHAGVIIFDLCGAGALGAVIGASTLGAEAYAAFSPFLPVILVPFLLAVLVQTAQGSRVVTAVITGEIIAGTGIAATIHPIPLILLISGGACIVSYVTDPYFWLVQRATGDDVAGVVKNYTLPLAAAGIAMAGIAVAADIFFF
ncbi:MAG TPA: GntP family permease [Methanoregulaceae archaeon]|nr:GntP family permease [Methanoregulaceae archaeon]HPD76054.1 GntP family permease [Methanoregulaceae archaeon]